MSDTNRVLVILPAYNEQAAIKRTVEKVIRRGFDYVVVNDGSTDKTKEILEDNKYNFIDLPKNLGIGGAVQNGYKYALAHGYNIAVQFDADGQHDVDSIKKLVQPIVDNEADFVIGSRFVSEEKDNFRSSRSRRVGIKVLSSWMRLLSGETIHDVTSGFRAANKSVVEKFAKNYPQKYPEPSSTFLLLMEGLRVREVSVRMYERDGGKSSITAWKSFDYMFSVMKDIARIRLHRGR